MNDPERILIIRPSALGDVCRSVPVLVSLRRAFPTARIDWLVQDAFADAVRWHPDLSEAVPFERRRLGSLLRAGRVDDLLEWLESLRRARYDLVLDCQGLLRSGLIALATGAPRRVGYANARELGWLGLNERHHVPADLHAVDRMLELVRHAGVEPVRDMRLYTGEPARQWVRTHPALAAPYAVVAPTSRWPGKRWPADRFAHVARHLVSRGLTVALVGGPSERGQCVPLLDLAARDARVVDLIGRTSVAQLMALIESSRLVIANDSAALHMAVGFDRPTVALYGPTRIDLVGPYRRDDDVIQHTRPGDTLDHKDEPTGRALMARITTEEVIAKAEARLLPSRGLQAARPPAP